MILLRQDVADRAEYREHGSGVVIAHELPVSVITWASEPSDGPSEVQTLILSDDAGHTGASPDDDAESWLRSWSQSGWERFDAAHREAARVATEQGTEIVIRPSSSGMLSDAVCTLNWCARGGGQNARLLLDPVGWIVPSMMRDLADHLDRIVELCQEMITQERAWGLLIREIPSELGESDSGLLLRKLEALIRQSPRCVVTSESQIPRIEP